MWSQESGMGLGGSSWVLYDVWFVFVLLDDISLLCTYMDRVYIILKNHNLSTNYSSGSTIYCFPFSALAFNLSNHSLLDGLFRAPHLRPRIGISPRNLPSFPGHHSFLPSVQSVPHYPVPALNASFHILTKYPSFPLIGS